jgi:hypothetical protein
MLNSSNNTRLFAPVALLLFSFCHCMQTLSAQPPAVPPAHELYAPFGDADRTKFLSPPMVYHPETWFHFIGGNVSKEGITADLEAIAAAGLSGIQLFHGQFGGLWTGVENPITCLSPSWEDAVRHTAEECRRLGLRFTMQNCPGWAMAGGPWIEPSKAMRKLVYTRIDVEGGKTTDLALPMPKETDEDWRDYRDVFVLSFPTPEGDAEPLRPVSVRSNRKEIQWIDYLTGKPEKSAILPPSSKGGAHWIEVSFPSPVILRTLELPSINWMNHAWCYEPGIRVAIHAVRADGSLDEAMNIELPQSSWQDAHPVSLACNERGATSSYRITIDNRHQTSLNWLRLYSAARKHNYESEAGWNLRSIERSGAHPQQSAAAYVNPSKVTDLSSSMDEKGRLKCRLPKGKHTILRIGHVNTGMKNGPAPPEGTGWECNKLSEYGPDTHFAGYTGRLSSENGALGGGLLKGMLMDSWECYTQTWTDDMEEQFVRISGYGLRRWLPAVFGFVTGDHETTARFLRDWRATVGELFATRFYGRMAKLAHDRGLDVIYETAAGDVFPADILEYFKYADVPMCEFWHPHSDSYVGAINYKPVKPTASAAHIYGKPRVAAEAFTSFDLNWDEHPEMLKGLANINMIEGVTHCVFHTYTHNPQIGFLPPGTSFGSGIGTPFLRGQTWWKYMPEFTTYLARCNYMLERGRPVSDVLWYLGDEIDHKPNQNAPFPEGFKYDYCNPDVLLNRLAVHDGQLVTPEGVAYRLLWIPQNERMLPETLEKILALAKAGATIVGNAPRCIATLSGGKKAQQGFDKAVKQLWGKGSQPVRKIGKGTIISGISLDEALKTLNIEPDVKVVEGKTPLWLHRCVDGADWYFICAPHGTGKEGIKTRLSFRNNGNNDGFEVWNPVTGKIEPADGYYNISTNRKIIELDIPPSCSYFVVVFKDEMIEGIMKLPFMDIVHRYLNKWTLSFPAGWGAPASIELDTLRAWKDLDISAEGRAFSGTAIYTTTFDVGARPNIYYLLDLGRVEMIASVSLNGKHIRTLWAPPYTVELYKYVQPGINTLSIEVTGSWFNRLVYDASLPESERKTWTISRPSKDAPLRESGLLGPVRLGDFGIGFREDIKSIGVPSGTKVRQKTRLL